MLKGTLKQPPSSRKKIVIIAIIAVVCLSASGSLYFMLKGSGKEQQDDFGGRQRREWNDNNLPNPNKQKPQEIMAYMDSDKFKNLSGREQFMYMREGGQKVMEYQMDTYFSQPDEKQKTAYLDQMIDRMQAQRTNFERMRDQMPRRRDVNEPNDPNRPQIGPQGGRRNFTPANMRARSERGTPSQRAQRDAFMQAMQKRMQQRGITMPNRGGRGGFGGGR